jgi:hypothetical protein
MAKWLDTYNDNNEPGLTTKDIPGQIRTTPPLVLGASVAWVSPQFGHRQGRVVLTSGDGWQLALNERTGGLTWVREDRCESCVS